MILSSTPRYLTKLFHVNDEILPQSRTYGNNPRYHIRIVSSLGITIRDPKFNDYATPSKKIFCERVILPRLDAYLTVEFGVDWGKVEMSRVAAGYTLVHLTQYF
jgi:hypothetical protein